MARHVREVWRNRRRIILEQYDDRIHRLAMTGDRDTVLDGDDKVIRVLVKERIADVLKARDRIAGSTLDDEGRRHEKAISMRGSSAPMSA